jgi:small-conductance mechanosensitive channel
MASAGIIGIAVGFAAKDTLANLFAGVSILADTPYKVGDMIVLDTGERGTVTHIGLRSSRVQTRDDIEVTVPNSVIANTRIKNESRPSERERVRVQFELSYGIDADKVRHALLEAAASTEHVLPDPAPRVRLTKVTDRSITFELLCWIGNPDSRGLMSDAVNSAAYRELLAAGIDALPSKHELFVRDLPPQVVEALAEALRSEKSYR